MYPPRDRRSHRIAVLSSLLSLLVAPLAFADGTGWYNQSQITKGRFEYSQK